MKFRPPLLALEEMEVTDWVTDDLPNLFWLLLLAESHEDSFTHLIRKMQTTLASGVLRDSMENDEAILSGRLIDIENIDARLRSEIIESLNAYNILEELVPDRVLATLRLYPEIPGGWLLVKPFEDRILDITDEVALHFAASAIMAAIKSGARNAKIKFPLLESLALGNKIKVGLEEARLHSAYPNDPANLKKAEATIRSFFLLFNTSGKSELRRGEVLKWANSFWKQNWHLSLCIPEEELDKLDTSTEEIPEVESAITTSIQEIARDASLKVIRAFDRFADQALDPMQSFDLHHSAKHEVVCGLVSRPARAILAVVRVPHLYSGEQSSHVTRLLAETKIVLSWMSDKPDDMYIKYQEYGRGKEKLALAHLESLVLDPNQNGSVYLKKAIGKRTKDLGSDLGLAFIEVNLEPTFSNISVRAMASEAELIDFYNHVFQSASSVIHGEWSSVSNYSMQRCANPLHKFHLVPSFTLEFPLTPELPKLFLRYLDEIIDLGLDILFGFEEKDATEATPPY